MLSFKTFSLVVFPLLLLPRVGHALDQVRFPSHVSVKELDSNLESQFLDALKNGSVLSVDSLKEEALGDDPVIKDVWLGNKPTIEGQIDRIDFTMESNTAKPDGSKDSYTVSVTFRPDAIVVRSSRPLLREFEGGVQLYYSGKRSRRTWLRGRGLSSIVAALPETVNSGLRGILICPLDLVRPDNPLAVGGANFVDNGFRPVSARLGVAGTVSGRLLSGVRPGMARAYISTTQHIPNELLHFDETYTKDPEIEVVYQGPELTDPIAIGPNGKLSEAVVLELEIQTPAGYKRYNKLTESLLVKPVERSFQFNVIALKREFIVNSQSCFSVIRYSDLQTRYTKEATEGGGE